jgi:signal transduction histidine kinase
VVLDVRLPEEVAESIEVAAYYVVAETLTNTTKHAEASRIDVTVEPLDGHLRVCMRDDGVGGADPALGSGLVGLKDRIEAFGGTMRLDSPSGGGTTLVAHLPLPAHTALGAEAWPSTRGSGVIPEPLAQLSALRPRPSSSSRKQSGLSARK